jgi:hypothetical protein
MNDFKAYLAGFVIVIAFSIMLMFFVRQFSLAITTVDIIEVESGVRCARMVTADGAAISCWQVESGKGGE